MLANTADLNDLYEDGVSSYIHTYKPHENCDYAIVPKGVPHLFPTARLPQTASYVPAPEPASVGLPEQGDPPFQ